MSEREMTDRDILPLDDLTPDPRNARKHTERNLATIGVALREVGAARSIVVDEEGVILAGNATVQAAIHAGLARVRIVEADGTELVAVRRSGLTPAQKRRLALFDNRAAELAEWDTEVLASLADDTNFSGLWDDDELAALLTSVDEAPTDLLVDPDEVPDPPAEPVTQSGDVWVLGRHRLLCGDATSREDVSRLMGGDLAALVFTDPPYGVAYEGGTAEHLTIANDDLDDPAFLAFLRDAFTHMLAVTRPGGAIYACHADSRGLVVRQAFVEAGWLLKQSLVWVKQSLVLGRQDYQWRHE
ncbi:MAG: DNA modification methylase, partial [Chloroflexota bacterium]|nr:DNA modification methylase [Chloroflexota bacterium]